MTAQRDPTASTGSPVPQPRGWLVTEVWLVFALSLGASGVRAAVQLIVALTSAVPLAAQAAVLNGSLAPGRPWLDLTLQAVDLSAGMVPVLLVAHLLTRSGERLRMLGFDATRPRRDVLHGAGLAAVVGGSGLAFYLAVHAVGADLTVVPEALPAVWWRAPVLLLAAAQNT